jgi:hypothetical protein
MEASLEDRRRCFSADSNIHVVVRLERSARVVVLTHQVRPGLTTGSIQLYVTPGAFEYRETAVTAEDCVTASMPRGRCHG